MILYHVIMKKTRYELRGRLVVRSKLVDADGV
jgi:hypothetical protein